MYWYRLQIKWDIKFCRLRSERLDTNMKLTNALEPSTTREATSCATTREPPSILWKMKIHYLIHNSSPRSILILFTHTCFGPPCGLLPYSFPINPYASLLFHSCYTPSPSHPPRLDNSFCILSYNLCDEASAMQIGFYDKKIIERERQTVLTCPVCHALSNAWEMSKTLKKHIACFQELHLSLVRFDVSVLLWSTSAWSRTDDWVLICYFQPLEEPF
jgi:hypothetical protein